MNGEKLLIEWKNRLGLQDWNITLEDNCNPNDMAFKNVRGCAVWQEPLKIATIQIADEKYFDFNYEQVLIHELLHLKLSLVSDKVDNLQERYMHQIIDDLARAFVDAKVQ